MAPRSVVLFAREPGREAREKGLTGREGEDLFASFALGWAQAAVAVGARLVVAAAPGEETAWRRRLASVEALFIRQRGRTFGARLEDSARQAAALGGPTVIVGGDVPPSETNLREAFDRLGQGADAVLAPAADGGVSLVALAAEDADLLREVAPRRRDVFTGLSARLARRGRRVAVVLAAGDVDGRRSLRSLMPFLPPALRRAARRILSLSRWRLPGFLPVRCLADRSGPPGLRAPPAAA